ncbi:MAG: ECF transporter S component [Clostridiales bacterium]|nr:ECF transporter S component [Clostridiales bacterium]
MNRQDFYLGLALELNTLKVPPELINTHIDQFKLYLQTLTEEEAENQIASFGDIKDLAKNIYRLLCGDDHTVETMNSVQNETVYDVFRVEEGESTREQSSYSPDLVSPDSAPILTEDSPLALDEIELQLDFDLNDDQEYITPDPTVFDEVNDQQHTEEPEDEEPSFEEIFNESQLIFPMDEPRSSLFGENNSALFWILFILTLPITAPLFIVAMALFGFMYIVVALLTAFFCACIFISALAGAAVTLTGGLYGITQLRSGNLPIGLFELGLALVIAGGTFLACCVFSLLSFKLTPKLFGLLTKLLRLFLDKLLSLIATLKKECAQR